MKILGLIGGTSWISTMDYYKLINTGINGHLGSLNYAECIIYSFNYEDIKNHLDTNNWEGIFQMVATACLHLELCGADAIILCANTTHLVAERLETEIRIPIIHIATVTANEIVKYNFKSVGLLGTKFTIGHTFFKSKLSERGIVTLIPDAEDSKFIHTTIYDELGKGIVKETTKSKYLSIIEKLIERGAEAIIFGCTEISLLIQQAEVKVPVFDTTVIHSNAAIEFALS